MAGSSTANTQIWATVHARSTSRMPNISPIASPVHFKTAKTIRQSLSITVPDIPPPCGEVGTRSVPGGGLAFAFQQLAFNGIYNRPDPLDFAVSKSHDQVTLAIQNAIALQIMFRLLWIGVLRAVEFNDEPRAMFDEVQNVSAKWRLPPEVMPLPVQKLELPP